MTNNLREIEYIDAKSKPREVAGNTIVVGVSETRLEEARNRLDTPEFMNNLVSEIGGSEGYYSGLYMVDGSLIERAFQGEKYTPPFSLRLITKRVEEGTLEKLKLLEDKLGLHTPVEL